MAKNNWKMDIGKSNKEAHIHNTERPAPTNTTRVPLQQAPTQKAVEIWQDAGYKVTVTEQKEK